MQIRFFYFWTLALSGLSGSTCAQAQAYPDKPIRVVTAGAGGGADFVARLMAQSLAASLGQQVVVENRGGGGGLIPGEIVAKAAPDGHTLLLYGNTIWLAPFLREKTPFDPIRDFAPITLAGSSPSILVVHPSLPVRSVRELITLAKSRPGAMNYGTAGTGSSSHLSAEAFKALAGINIVRVNYKGAGATITDLIAGEIQMTFGTAASVASHVKSGRLRALAVTSARGSALFPSLPTIASSGLTGYESVSLHALFAPAKTPAAIIGRLNQESVRVLRTSEVRQRLLEAGVEAVGSSPEELAAAIKADMTRMGTVIKNAGIREE